MRVEVELRGWDAGGVDELTGGRRVDRDRSRGDYRQVSRAERWRSDTSRRAGQKRRGKEKTTGREDSGQKLYYQTVLSSCASLRNTVQYMSADETDTARRQHSLWWMIEDWVLVSSAQPTDSREVCEDNYTQIGVIYENIMGKKVWMIQKKRKLVHQDGWVTVAPASPTNTLHSGLKVNHCWCDLAWDLWRPQCQHVFAFFFVINASLLLSVCMWASYSEG